ncbi:outer membrane beta-barrel protein [Sulfurimonas sp.]|uniref:outer membrane beta-barrel protein n=1 Tax=Sulfurimonas sp. TaxID=2022749 RepID=UPI002AB0F65D|nr:outer membrane beta-barrel protein [Sulfurimonas sp.]
MKKIILSALASILITTGATADSFFDYKQEIGIGTSIIERSDSEWEGNYGININGKLMKSINDAIAIGITINMDYNPSVQLSNASSNPTEYNIDFLPTVTYIINKEIDISVMFGYEYGKYAADWGDWNTQGFSYGLAASYAITAQLRANISALRTSMDFTTSSDSAVNSTENTNRYTIGIGYNF